MFQARVLSSGSSLKVLRLGVFVSVFCLFVAGCADSGRLDGLADTESESSILAIGDSFFEFNTIQEASIPDVIGEILLVPVVDAAQGGAYFTKPDPEAASGSSDVSRQYREGDWEWVVVTGSGNDLNDICGCGECDSVLDALIAADGTTGEIPDLVRNIASDGVNVMLVGYYDLRSDADFGFDRCGDEVTELRTRMELTAGRTDGVWFVSAADVVSVDDTDAYAEDRVHPSTVGSELVGEHVAAAIQKIESD